MSEDPIADTSRASISSNSSSSSDNSPTDFILYSQRPEWNDIKPMAQEDGPHPVVAIAYSERFRDTFDYFRAVLAKNEMSIRALDLTADCVSLNPSNYTIWYFRRLVIEALKYDLFKELKYIESVITENPKNYQVWHHRKCIVEAIKRHITERDNTSEADISPDKQRELKELAEEEKIFLTFMVRQDSKNYHCWQHRQWLINDFNIFDGELEYTEELIEDDIRNNSAWNHRYYVIKNTIGFVDSVLESEVKFTCRRIRLAPNNESAWNYLKGILSKVGLNSAESAQQMCEELYKTIESHRSPHLLAFMVDSIEETLEKQSEPNSDLLNKAIQLCEQLSNKIDIIRKEYWNYIARELNHNFGDKQ